jgi:hypothetical protein
MDNPELARSLRLQAAGCRNLGSPFHGDLLELAAEDLESGGPVAALLAPWADADLRKLVDDAMPLRLLGGLHDLVLSGDDRALAATYPMPGREADAATAWIAARTALIRHHDRIAAFMTHEPQTNEVRRSACLAPGFLIIAQETGLPIRAFEVAASAGLNLNWDRYLYRFGETQWGDPAATVVMDTEWTGSAPPVNAKVEVIERAACDRRPGDLTDPVQRRRLLAYIWPDQFERLDRIRAAIDLALDRPRRSAAGRRGDRPLPLGLLAIHAAGEPGGPGPGHRRPRRESHRRGALRLAAHGAAAGAHEQHGGAADPLAGRRGPGAGQCPSARRLG